MGNRKKRKNKLISVVMVFTLMDLANFNIVINAKEIMNKAMDYELCSNNM